MAIIFPGVGKRQGTGGLSSGRRLTPDQKALFNGTLDSLERLFL